VWNIPGGKQEERETCDHAVRREFLEETGLDVSIGALAYVAESFDPHTNTHFTAFCFHVSSDGDPKVPNADEHVRAIRWVRREELADILLVPVIREPLIGYLRDPQRRYFSFADAGIAIAFDAQAARALGAMQPDEAETREYPPDDPGSSLRL
jgi:ADP-ribose pyrophosphatase YjhB (NUDIX family)